jgi:hypothetical protein
MGMRRGRSGSGGASRAAGTFSDSPGNVEEEVLTFDAINAYENEVQ